MGYRRLDLNIGNNGHTTRLYPIVIITLYYYYYYPWCRPLDTRQHYVRPSQLSLHRLQL